MEIIKYLKGISSNKKGETMEKRREDIIRELKIVRESGENLQKKYDEMEKETSKELEVLSVVIGNLINKEEQLGEERKT